MSDARDKIPRELRATDVIMVEARGNDPEQSTFELVLGSSIIGIGGSFDVLDGGRADTVFVSGMIISGGSA